MSRGKFIAINMRSGERSKIETLSSKLKELEEQDKKNSKASRRQEITDQSKNEGDRGTKTLIKIDKYRSWFFEKINK